MAYQFPPELVYRAMRVNAMYSRSLCRDTGADVVGYTTGGLRCHWMVPGTFEAD